MIGGENSDKTARQAEMFANRLIKREQHLRKWAGRTGAGAYRLYDRDIPEIPLALDLYRPAGGGDAALCGSLYRRPYEKDAGEEALWLTAMKKAAAHALGIDAERIFFRERKKLKNGERYAPGGGDSRTDRVLLDTAEGDLRFRVNLTDYLDTGLFPDRRLLRARIRAEARGKRVLNLFAYTCAFSVCAAAGGAVSVDSVDKSRRSLDWGMTNFALNGLDAGRIENFPPHGAEASPTGNRPRFIAADILRFLPAARESARRWDLIILDPPSFSNSAKMTGTLDIRRDHREIIGACLELLAPGGVLYFSVNARSFRLDGGDWPAARVRDITGQFRDEDFRGKKVPACFVFEKDRDARETA
ncbi:MAG: class I SAM-dependent methyltransferase [Spirochaetaceae bacterium]|jgi:23S rRNA G2069 N7-methylase RlmK/C1962 C5-methylase RlmI|nr:class I SAM-dependent methyltransferase [Spirochaetaceae bacterium]